MQFLLDTTVIVAALVQSHPHHKLAIQWINQDSKKSVMVATHSLAEVYAVLTRLPLSPTITPELAYRLIHDNLKHLGNIVSLDPNDYMKIISELSLCGLKGGIIYDAIILKTAQKNKASHLVTFNKKHFISLCDDPKYIISPDE